MKYMENNYYQDLVNLKREDSSPLLNEYQLYFIDRFIRTQREQAFKQGVESLKLERRLKSGESSSSTGVTYTFKDNDRTIGYNEAVSDLEAIKASLLSPAAARLAADMAMQKDLANN